MAEQKANTIILEMSGARKDDIADLRHGEGKLFKRIASTVESLKENGAVSEDAQPVIILVQRRSEKLW